MTIKNFCFHWWKREDEVHKIKDPVTKFIHTIGMQVRRCIICGKKQQRINGKAYRWATHISQR